MAIINAPVNGKTKLNASRITLSMEPGCQPTEHERTFLFLIKAKEKRRIAILLSMVAYSLPRKVYPRRERKIAIWRLTLWKVTTDFKDWNCR
jgi:hypothetical protein